MNVVDTSVRNNMDSVLGINGVSIPAGQSRKVRGLDLDDERVRARIEAGDIEVAGHKLDERTVAAWADTEEALAAEDSAEDHLKPSLSEKLWGGVSER